MTIVWCSFILKWLSSPHIYPSELVKKKRKCLSKKRSEGARHEVGLIRCFKFVYLVLVVSESERLLDRTAIQKCVQRTRKF